MIGNSVTEIGKNAFAYGYGLKNITLLAITPPSIDSQTFDNVYKTKSIVYVPEKSFNAYKAADGWKYFENIVGLTDEEVEKLTGINSIATDKANGGKMYNLQGVEVGPNYKGVVIVNGKKILRK